MEGETLKKFIISLLVIISMFSFFILYNEQKQIQTYNMKNAEHHLKNSYEVTIPSKINLLPKGQQYKEILNSSNNDDASIYFTRVDEVNGREKIIKYIYANDNEYMNKFHLLWGKKLDKSLMNTDYFLSTEDTGNKNQIGKIASFNGIPMEIHTLQGMIDDGLLLDGPCTVTVPDNKSIYSFKDMLGDGIGVKDMDISKSQDIGDVSKNSYIEISSLFFIIMILILYDILKSYKKIAVKKLLGFSTIDIWKFRILRIIFTQFITMILSTIIMILILFKDLNIYYIYFLKNLLGMYFVLMLITFLVASIPYIYVNNINISAAIKNKYPSKEIMVFNTIVKIILCLGFIFLINKQAVNYNNIKMAFNSSYKIWENVSNYRVLSLEKLGTETEYSNKNIDIYKYFNSRGALFAGFGMYEKQSVEANTKLPSTEYFAMVNPNYLKENSVYDINGKKNNAFREK